MSKNVRAGGTHWALHAPSGERKYLNAEERLRFIAAAEREEMSIRLLCLTLVYAGCRISEALALTARDVETGHLAIRSLKKRGKTVVRYVPVPASLIAELRAHEDEGFLWPWGRTWGWHVVKQVMADAGIQHLPASPKGLRHAFGVHAVLSGVPITLVQKWLGHASVATTAIYTDVMGPEEQAVAARMW